MKSFTAPLEGRAAPEGSADSIAMYNLYKNLNMHRVTGVDLT